MKGSNELQINQATMIEAVQMYLDSQMREGLSPVVIGVKSKPAGYGADLFTVTLDEKKTEGE